MIIRTWNPRRRVLAGALLASMLALLAFTRVQPRAPEPARGPDDLAVELDRRLTQDVTPILAKYCLGCHSGEDAPNDVRLDQLTSVREALTGKLDVRLIKEMVGAASMPPKREPQPTEHERLVITQWCDSMLGYVPTDAPIDPGWFTIHRLNRTEYRNTLRDLLGIDPKVVDLTAKLPRDDTGYGFDNIADVLSTSPLAVEQYLEAAEKAIEAGLGPIVECGDHPRDLRPLEGSSGQPLPRGGYFLFSAGPAAGKFVAPVTGQYMIRVRAWETHGGDEDSRLALRVEKRQIKEFTVSASRESPQEFEVRTRLTKGAHTISANFINDYYVKDVADRNLGVDTISVAGPLDEATTERPAAWKKVFGEAAGRDETARAQAVLGAFATRAYRRAASAGQVASLMRVYRSQREAGRAFEPTVRTAMTAALVSPHFLFRSVAHPDAANPGAKYTLDGYELASRLSYFLWSSMPDGALFDAAKDGSLLTDAGLAAQVKRMLADDRSGAFVENFAGQWLQLRGLESVAIDRAKFPEYNDLLRKDMASEATLFFGDVLRSDRSVLELLDSRSTFLNERLAKFYGLPEVKGEKLRRVELPEGSVRGGVLTMGAVLTLTSNTTRTSPVKRGLFVLDQILGAPPPPPPADIPPLEQSAQANPNATVRERLAAHVAVASCAACHTRLDPLGLAFEHFDATGRWRDTEGGLPVDATGTLPGGTVLNGSGDLKRTLLARSDQFVESLCGKVLTYALGRGVEPFDRPAIRLIAQRTRASDDRLPALIESVVLSETFRTCRGRKASHD
ncbi:MAG: DUF1592 domain-containing protein [Planctomycetota bacterium]